MKRSQVIAALITVFATVGIAAAANYVIDPSGNSVAWRGTSAGAANVHLDAPVSTTLTIPDGGMPVTGTVTANITVGGSAVSSTTPLPVLDQRSIKTTQCTEVVCSVNGDGGILNLTPGLVYDLSAIDSTGAPAGVRIMNGSGCVTFGAGGVGKPFNGFDMAWPAIAKPGSNDAGNLGTTEITCCSASGNPILSACLMTL